MVIPFHIGLFNIPGRHYGSEACFRVKGFRVSLNFSMDKRIYMSIRSREMARVQGLE